MGERSGAVRPEAIEIRPLRTHDELQACLALQRATWGDAPGTLVPTPLLLVVQRIGGVSAGAFAPDGTLLGFVFGMTGVERGELVHWSDMLAVRPEARDLGLGRRLKEHQRDEVAKLGVRRIYWTYDPLVAKNAHFNLNVLGARVHEYVVDMYGDTGSTLHAGLGTDRIIVAWPVEESTRPARATVSAGDALVVNAGGARFDPPDPEPAVLRIEIPSDIFAARERSPAEARAWRESSRAAFEWALARRYRAAGFVRDDDAGRTCYVLEHA